MDLLLALLPWKIVLGLQMKKKEKLGVAVAMSMSVLWVPHLVSVRLSWLTAVQCCRLGIRQGRTTPRPLVRRHDV